MKLHAVHVYYKSKTISLLIWIVCELFSGETAYGQEEKSILPDIRWLSGAWQGVGNIDQEFDRVKSSMKKITRKDFHLTIAVNDTFSAIIKGSDGAREYFHEETVNVNYLRSEKRLRMLYLSEYPEGGRINDRELLIDIIDRDHINIILTYYARSQGNLILHGAFQRVSNH